jgi:predicted ATPase
LLTLVGTGGIGKTRLGIEVASRYQDHFPGGVCFVSLAPLKTHAYLVPAIADALGFAFQGQLEPRLQLLNYLRPKELLLILDNAEHLLAGTELFTEILEAAPRVKLLVTSRERLYLQSEWVFEIQGLPVPPEEHAARAERYSSVALFIQAAQRAQVGFEIQPDQRASLVRICRLVEGMPLGIELAAAWVSLLSCREIAQEIARSLDFLTTSMRDVPTRQRSLRAAFDHSWSLLAEDERMVLSRLSVFQGGFERQAAEQVAQATLPALLALTSKSLIRRTERGRYDLHEVIRQYALAYLRDDPQYKVVLDRHSRFYLTMLRDRENALKGAAQREASRTLTDEIDNLRAAWTWAVKQENYPLIEQSMRALGRLYEIGGWLREGVGRFETLVEALHNKPKDELSQKVLGIALFQQGLLSFRWGEFQDAQTRFAESLEFLRPLGDQALLAAPLVLWGTIMHLFGEFARASSLIDEGLTCAQAAGDRWFEAYARLNQGYISSLYGHYQEGYRQMMAGLAIFRELGDPQYTALSLNFSTPTLIHLGYYQQAYAGLRESLQLCEQFGDRWGGGSAYRFLGLLKMNQGEIDQAQILFHKSLEYFAEYTSGWDIVQSLVYLGQAAALAGEFSEAQRIYLEALPQGMEANAISIVMDILIGLAELQLLDGENEGAYKLANYVFRHPSATQAAKDRASQLVKGSQARLSPEQFKSVDQWVENQSLQDLVGEILGEEYPDPKR